jgi:hypothetical protein
VKEPPLEEFDYSFFIKDKMESNINLERIDFENDKDGYFKNEYNKIPYFCKRNTLNLLPEDFTPVVCIINKNELDLYLKKLKKKKLILGDNPEDFSHFFTPFVSEFVLPKSFPLLFLFLFYFSHFLHFIFEENIYSVVAKNLTKHPKKGVISGLLKPGMFF